MYQKSDHLKEMSSGASLPSQRFAAILSHVPVRIQMVFCFPNLAK